VALAEQTRKLQNAAARTVESKARPARRGPAVSYGGPIPEPPDLKLHLLHNYSLEEIFRYINPVMLYTRHLGFKNFASAIADGDPKAIELQGVVAAVEEAMLARPDIAASAAYRFFPAHSDGDRTLMVYAPDGKRVLESFTFGRQTDDPGLCLADYVTPVSTGRTDYVAMMVTTIGEGVRALAEEWKDKGEYLRSHVLQILALEGAEAFAELLHQKIRQMWGFGDPPAITHKDLFQAHYHGKRFSFGYPACPRLEDQAQLFRLLELEESGMAVRLTEGYMMDPESSVSALIFHNPLARYFALSSADIEALERELNGAPQAAAS